MHKSKEVTLILQKLIETYKGTLLGSISPTSTINTTTTATAKRTPFQILISTVLSQRTQDANTARASNALFEEYSTPEQLVSAPIKNIERLIKPSGFYKTKATRIKEISQVLVEEYDSVVPKDINELTSLPGVGRKTAGCVLVYAFNEPAIPVDTHVHRISNRLGWVSTKTPDQTEQDLMRLIPRDKWILVNDLLVSHGQNICKPITPLCSKCSVRKYCKRVGVTKSK